MLKRLLPVDCPPSIEPDGLGNGPIYPDPAEMVEFFAVHLQADDGVVQACALCQLSDCHYTELLSATESAHSVVAIVALHATLESVPQQLVHDLGENETSFVHDLHTPC